MLFILKKYVLYMNVYITVVLVFGEKFPVKILVLFIFTGLGVRTSIKRNKGDFLLFYHGELITEQEGERREARADSTFRYFFQHKHKAWWYVQTLNIRDMSDDKFAYHNHP